MVLPLLFSLGLPALAASGSVPFLASLGASIGTAGMAGLGAGLGSLVQTGDLGEGIKTGLTSFLGGKILGGLTGSTSANALNAGQGIQTEAFGELAQPKFLQAFPSLTEQGGLFASEGMKQAAAGAFAPGVMPAAFMGQTMADAYDMNRAAKKDEGDSSPPPMPRPPIRTYNPDPYGGGNTGEGLYFQYQRPPAPEGYQPQYPYYYADGGLMSLKDLNKDTLISLLQLALPSGGGASSAALDAAEGEQSDIMRELGGVAQNIGSYTLPPYLLKGMGYDRAADIMGYPFDDEGNFVGPSVKRPKKKYDGGLMGLRRMQEGGEVEAEADEIMMANGMNEKDVIVKAIEAIKGISEQPEIDLALFVQKYGEEALRDLVGRVQSGELDDTVARFENGDKGMVRGPGDGSGVDDMVPATLEGEQDVLLSDGEYVLRKNTTDALEKAYGGGFLDIVNRAEEDAPRQLEQMVG